MANLGLENVLTIRRITVADGSVSKFMCFVDKVHVFFAESKLIWTSSFFSEILSDAIICCPAIEELGTCIDLGNQSFSVLIGDIAVDMPQHFDKRVEKEDLRDE